MAGTPPLLPRSFPCPKIPIQQAVYCSIDAAEPQFVSAEWEQGRLIEQLCKGKSGFLLNLLYLLWGD